MSACQNPNAAAADLRDSPRVFLPGDFIHGNDQGIHPAQQHESRPLLGESDEGVCTAPQIEGLSCLVQGGKLISFVRYPHAVTVIGKSADHFPQGCSLPGPRRSDHKGILKALTQKRIDLLPADATALPRNADSKRAHVTKHACLTLCHGGHTANADPDAPEVDKALRKRGLGRVQRGSRCFLQDPEQVGFRHAITGKG